MITMLKENLYSQSQILLKQEEKRLKTRSHTVASPS